MADSAVAITAGSGTSIDTRTEGTNGNHRQVVVLGDPATNAGVAPVDATNGLSVNVTNASVAVVGTKAAGASESGGGGPVKVGGVYNTTRPTYSDGQRGDAQITSRGGLLVDNEDYSTSGNISAADSASSSVTGEDSQSIITGTPTNNSSFTATGSGNTSFSILITGTWVGTLQFERSLDAGTTYTPVGAFSAGTAVIQSTATGNGAFHGNASSATNIRVRATAWTSGTATVRILLGQGTGTITVGNPVRLTDSSMGTNATIKAASTAAQATDTAIVVGLSPNSPIPAGTNAIGKLSANDGVDIGDVTINNASGASAVNIQDGGNSITVDGTVAVTGVATAANQTTIIGHLDGVEGSLTTLAGAVSGTEMQVDVLSSALPTGASTSAKQDTIIGHLDGVEGLLTTIDADTGTLAGAVASNKVNINISSSDVALGGGTQYTEGNTDSSFTGTMLMWETNESTHTAGVVSPAAPLPVDVININGGSPLDVILDSTSETKIGDGTDTVTVTGSGASKVLLDVGIYDDNGNQITTFTGTSMTDDAAFTPGSSSVSPMGAMFDNSSPDSVDEGDVGIPRMSANRNIYTQIRSGDGAETGATVAAASDSLGAGNNSLITYSLPGLMDGSSNMTRARTVVNATNSTGTGIQAVGLIAQLDDTSPTAITENQFGNLRMTPARALHGALYTPNGDSAMDDTNDAVKVNVVAGSSSGTQYTEGDTDASIAGTAILWEDTSDTLATVSSASPLPVNTELPAAAALSDDMSNPTAPAVGAHLLLWDSAGWDRAGVIANSDGDGGGLAALHAGATMRMYNGTTWDRVRGDTTNGVDVDVTRVIPGTSATHLGKAEDAVHTTGDTGVFMLGVRNSAMGTQTSADGDYSPITVDSAGRTNVAGQIGHDAVYNGNPVQMGAYASAAVPTDVSADGDAVRLWADRAGRMHVIDSAQALNGLSTFRSLDIDETEEDIKTSAGAIYGMWVTNTATSTRWIKFYNATAANVTVGTTTPVITWGIPGNSSDDISGLFGGGKGIGFDTAISVAATTGVADNDTGAPGANDVIINVFYK